jgi:hypothetical protein
MRLAMRFIAGLVVLGALAMVGCAPAAAPTVYTQVTDGTLKAGDDIPAPSGDPLLTVTGNIGKTNVDDSIQMDLKTIESVGLVDYSMTDPFTDKDVTFEGVLMSDLLALWGVPDDAKTLHMVALNDYAVDVPIEDLRKYPVIFALKQDGAYMPIADRGPAMLVYPYKDFQFDQELYNNYWIWQIKSIEVQ